MQKETVMLVNVDIYYTHCLHQAKPMSSDERDISGHAFCSVYVSLCSCRRYVPQISSHHVTPVTTTWNLLTCQRFFFNFLLQQCICCVFKLSLGSDIKMSSVGKGESPAKFGFEQTHSPKHSIHTFTGTQMCCEFGVLRHFSFFFCYRFHFK